MSPALLEIPMKIPVMKPNGTVVMVGQKLAGVLVKRRRFSFVDGAGADEPAPQPQEKAPGGPKSGSKAASRATNSKKGS